VTRQRVTLQRVAEAAGVSHTAVSLAIRGQPGLADAQRQRILEIANKLGYRPRLAAQMLASDRAGSIGLIAESVGPTAVAAGGFTSPIIASFLYACAAADQRNLVEFFPSDDAAIAFEPPHQLAGGLVDGVLLAGHISTNLRSWLNDSKQVYPWVSIDEPADYAVLSAVDVGVERAVEALVRQGHRRLAYLGGTLRFTTHRLKAEGLARACNQHNIDTNAGRWVRNPESLVPADSVAERLAFVRGCLAGPDRPTAFLVHGTGARDVVLVATQLGLSIPDDLSVIAFCTQAEAQMCAPMLTAVEPPLQRMVERALAMLLSRIAGASQGPTTEFFDPTLVTRETVGPARQTRQSR
jgi:LacI family transcriptional regulator